MEKAEDSLINVFSIYDLGIVLVGLKLAGTTLRYFICFVKPGLLGGRFFKRPVWGRPIQDWGAHVRTFKNSLFPRPLRPYCAWVAIRTWTPRTSEILALSPTSTMGRRPFRTVSSTEP